MGEGALVLRLMLTAGLSVAACGGLVAAALYALGGRGPLFRPVGPARHTPNGAAVFGAFVIFLVSTPLAAQVLGESGFFRTVYGANFPEGWRPEAAATIRFLWSAAIAFPVQLGLIQAWVRALNGVVPWAGRNWAPSVVTAYLTWLVVTPAAFSVYVLANLAHTWLTRKPPDRHPLTAMGDAAGPREWALFVLQTVLLAPALEELLFRGLLLPWLAERRPPRPEAFPAVPPVRRPLAIMLLAAGVAVVLHLDEVQRAWTAGDRTGAAVHLVPGAFFLALLSLLAPSFARLRRHLRLRSRQQVQAIVASSALFAAVHANVWPSPVALFVLAVGLGYLYLRTRALVGPVVVHGLFNAVSAVYLLLGGPA